MYKDLINNLFEVISYDKMNGKAQLIGIESAVRMKPGVYGIVNGAIEKYDNMDAKVSFKSEEMYNNFINITTWNKKTMNKTEAFMLSKQLSESYMKGVMQVNVGISNTFKLKGPDYIREDIVTILFALTYKLILEYIGQYRVEYNKNDIAILNNILVEAEDFYPITESQGRQLLEVVIQYLSLFLKDFAYPFAEVTIASINNQAVDMRIGNIQNLIFNTKQIIMTAAPGITEMYEYTNITGYIINVLEQSNILTDLVNTMYKYQYPYRDIKGLFGTTAEDQFILRMVTATIDYFKNRITKLASKGLNKSDYENISNYEKILERIMVEFLQDPRTAQNFDVRTFYSYDKKITIITNKKDSNIKNYLQDVLDLKKKISDTCITHIGADHINETVDKENRYSDFYISTISKFKMETIACEGMDMLEIRYTEPYINNYKGELEWRS